VAAETNAITHHATPATIAVESLSISEMVHDVVKSILQIPIFVLAYLGPGGLDVGAEVFTMWVLAAILGVVTLVLFDPTLVKKLILLLVAGYKAGCRCVHMQ